MGLTVGGVTLYFSHRGDRDPATGGTAVKFDTEATYRLKARTMDALGTWESGYLGDCPLTGRAMFLTEQAAIDYAIRTGDRHATGKVDGAHAPLSKRDGGTRIVLTDARAQQLLGSGITPGTEGCRSMDTGDRAGITADIRRVRQAVERLSN